MTLVRYGDRTIWNPWRTLGDLERQMNRIFGEMPNYRATEESWRPAIDIRDEGDTLVLEADVPGLKKEDIEITFKDNVLTLKGERNREKEDKGKGYHRVERSYGSFERSFELPEGVDSVKIKADFRDGVLRVTLPKAEAVKPLRIEVSQN